MTSEHPNGAFMTRNSEGSTSRQMLQEYKVLLQC